MNNLRDNMMCIKSTCPAKKSCARYSINPERGQALYHPDPITNIHGSCEHFIANDTKICDLKPHKYYLTQHREDSATCSKLPLPVCVDGVKISTKDQVELFERRLLESRVKSGSKQLYNAQDMFEKGIERGHVTRAASDHTVDIRSAEATRRGIHIVVMADNAPAVLKGLSDEMNEVTIATY